MQDKSRFIILLIEIIGLLLGAIFGIIEIPLLFIGLNIILFTLFLNEWYIFNGEIELILSIVFAFLTFLSIGNFLF